MAQWKPGSGDSARGTSMSQKGTTSASKGTTMATKGTTATPKGTDMSNHKPNKKTPDSKKHSGQCMMSMGKRDKYC